MLNTFRTKIKFWSHFFLWPVIISFIAFYGWSFLDRPPSAEAAVIVGDMEIPASQVVETRRRITQYYRDMYKENFDRFAENVDFNELAVDKLIDDALLNDVAEELGINISTQDIQDAIIGIPAFQVNGTFSTDIYQRALSRVGMTPLQYEAAVAQDLKINRARDLVGASGAVSNHELRDIYMAQNVKISSDYYMFRVVQFRDAVDENTERIRQYYEDNPEDFRVGDQIKLNYILFDPKKLESEADVDEFDIEDHYEMNFDDYQEPEQVKARHILVTVDNNAEEDVVEAARLKTVGIIDRLNEGEDFATLAKEISECPSAKEGGDLGFFAKGFMDKSFEDAAWDLEMNQITEEPVRTQFGFHVIQKTGYKKEGWKSLEEVKGQIEKFLRTNESKIIAMRKAQNLFDRIDPFRTKLTDLVQDTDMTIETTDFFEPGLPPGLLGYAHNLKDILVNLDKDEISIPVETTVGVFLFEIVETKESHIPPFEQIEKKAIAQYRNSVASQLAREKAETVHRYLLDNHTWEEAGTEFDLVSENTGLVTRDTVLPRIGGDETTVNSLFELEVGAISDVFTVQKNSIIFRVTEKKEFDQKAFEEELPKMRHRVLNERKHLVVDSWLEQRKKELAQQGKFKINPVAF
jgi:peptidyl-prolyl cis-trans isomerase D